MHRLEKVYMDAGGKGINVSKCIQAMGETSKCMGFLAGSSSVFIQEELCKLQIDCDMLWVEGLTRTNLKVIDETGN